MAHISSRKIVDHAIEKIANFFSGKVAFAATNVATGEVVSINEDAVLPTASTIKTAILAELFRQHHEGQIDINSRVQMAGADIVAGSGVLKELEPHLDASLLDVATLMIIVSDNTATNMVLDRIGGPAAVNQTMDSYGLTSIRLHNRVDFDAIGDDVRRFAESSALDFMKLNEMLAQGKLVNASASQQMMDILERQQYLDQVPRYFKYMTGARGLGIDQQISVACKTGFFPGTRVDAGIISLPEDVSIAYCAMAHGSKDQSIVPESEPAIANGLFGRLILEYWWPREWDSTAVTVPSRYVDEVLGEFLST